MQQLHRGKGEEETMGQSEVENEGLPGQATGYITLLQDKAMGFKTGSGELDWGVPE